MCTSHYYISIFKPVIIFILLCIGESPQVSRNCHFGFGIPAARYALFTATATKATKMILFDMMELTVEDTFRVEKLPTRSNICY